MALMKDENKLEQRRAQTHLRFRFWLEMMTASCSAVLVLTTWVWKDWIEIVFRVDLDHYTGSLEQLICTVLLIAAVALFAIPLCEWRRIQKSEY